MVINAYARAWTLDSIDRNQEYILYFDAVAKRWELRTLQDGAYVQTRAMYQRPGRRAERPQRAKPEDRLMRADTRSTIVRLPEDQQLTYPAPRPPVTLGITASSPLGAPGRSALEAAQGFTQPALPMPDTLEIRPVVPAESSTSAAGAPATAG